MLVKLTIDFENRVERWWDSGGRALWEGIAEGFDRNSIVIDAELAESWIAEAQKIPGWEDGPDYAPHPVSVRPVDEGEDF